MPYYVLSIAKQMLNGISQPTITVFGVSYKGNVDDTRETPALKIIRLSENEGYSVKIYDPIVKSFEYPLLDLEKALFDSDCIIIVSDHAEFRDIEPSKFANLMRNRNVIDTRNILDKKSWEDSGFNYRLLGCGINSYNNKKRV